MKTVAIIGSGLGGLECAYLLSSNGWKVCVFEQASQVGGCMQSFSRKGYRFDTGFHHVGMMKDGGMLRDYFKELKLADLPWCQLDTDCQDEIHIGKRVYKLPSGMDNVRNYLSGLFPEYSSKLEELFDAILTMGEEAREIPAMDFLKQLFGDSDLYAILTATSPRLEFSEAMSLYEYIHIAGAFMDGCWRLDGGASLIVQRLTEGIEANGGSIRTKAKVTGVQIEKEQVCRLEINGSEQFSTDFVISDIHPSILLELIDETQIRKTYRKRITSLGNSSGILTLNIILKDKLIPYKNRNIFSDSTMICLGHSENGYARTADILKFVPEGFDYEKEIENCLATAESILDGFNEAIEQMYVSTPATYERYTSTPGGSAFGIVKDWRCSIICNLSVRTPVRNLFLTGQNVNLHGVMGVTATAFETVKRITSI